MSWLQSIGEESRSSGWGVTYRREPSAEEFAGYRVFVERDERSGHMATEDLDGHTWVVAYPSYELLEGAAGGFGGDVDHIQTTGRELKHRLRSSDTMAQVGILWRASRDAEGHVALWPRTATVSRVAVDPA